MFRRDQDRERLDISGRQLQRLYRSVCDVQVAMAGFPSQEATAYVFSFCRAGDFGAAVVLHLKVSQKLAFFFPEASSVDREKVGAVLNEGLHFAESMGFILADLDIHLLDDAEKESFWQTLPLHAGFASSPVAEAEEPPVTGEATTKEPPAGSGSDPVDAGEESAPPTPQEMAARKKRLVENLGRFLASF